MERYKATKNKKFIYHVIVNKDGKDKLVKLNPLKAIQEHCKQCLGYDKKEIEKCSSDKCSLHPFRFGKMPKII